MKLFIAILAALCAVSLAGCATAPELRIEVREVRIPVPVACAADPGPAPAYPDTAEALAAAPDVFEGVKLLKAGRLLRQARERELEAALAGCAGLPTKPP